MKTNADLRWSCERRSVPEPVRFRRGRDTLPYKAARTGKLRPVFCVASSRGPNPAHAPGVFLHKTSRLAALQHRRVLRQRGRSSVIKSAEAERGIKTFVGTQLQRLADSDLDPL